MGSGGDPDRANFNMDQENLEARASKSFGSRDRTEVIYSHNNYLYRYAAVAPDAHEIDRVALNNSLFFDTARRYNLNSRFTWYDQEGTTSFRRVEAAGRPLLAVAPSSETDGKF